MIGKKSNWRAFAPALCLTLVGVGAVGFAAIWPHRAAVANRPLAVFALQRDAMAVIVDAGARIVSPGNLPGSVIAIAEDPDILTRLYESGALLVLRADAAVGCVTESAIIAGGDR